MTSNLATYSDPHVVRAYMASRDLFAAEIRIVELLSDRLGQMAMLDVGVGAGRTTLHFAPRVREYVAVDYARPMVEACRKAFAAHPAWIFDECDARDLSQFSDARFDLVCFSFNGIDYVSHDDRLRILRALKRVCRPKGFVVLSSHNLQNAREIWRWNWPGRWRSVPKELGKNVVKFALNAGFLFGRQHDYAILNDGTYHFGLNTYYIRPEAQIRQLMDVGFTDVRVFSFLTGEEISDRRALEQTRDPSPYYLCTLAE